MKLTSPTVINELLDKYSFRTRKRFGQNFLTDENIVRKIADAANLTDEETVIEIGPGIGTLTRELAQRAGQVVAVEIDRDLIPILEETLADFDNVNIVNEDILKVDFDALTEAQSFKVAANLPYYITTPVIMTLLESDLPISQMSFLVQNEVADRLAGEPGNKDYGALSVIAQYYADVEKAFDVPSSVFKPRPKVDSALIVLERKYDQDPTLKKENFFRVVKAAFANRRKTLLNSLSANLGLSRETVGACLEELNIDPRIRAERLTGEQFADITKLLYPEN